MAVLSAADRSRIERAINRYVSRQREGITLAGADIRAAVDAADSWVDTNAAAFNSALPLAARNGFTASQKSLLLAAVVLMRHNLAFLRQMFGEVD